MYLLLRRSNLVVVVVGQPTSNPPQIEFIHTHQKIRNNPLSHQVLIGDEAQVEARFGPFGDSANLKTR